MNIGFIGLGIMGSRMAATCRRPATRWSSSTGLVKKRTG